MLKLYISKFILFAAVFILFLSCKEHASYHYHSGPVYKSFKEIPGITPQEIQDIEALKAKNLSFVYGTLLGTEAFYGKNNELKGYVPLLCEHLTELFGINFKPTIYEFDDLIAGLASGEIDFTSDLMATQERRKTYYMTGALAFDTYEDTVLTDLSPLTYNSISLSTQKSELAPIISIVQKMLQTDCFRYLIEIYNNGHQEYVKLKMENLFTEEEREYISKNHVIRFAAEFDNYPISFYNKHEKQWQGVAIDVIREIEKITDLSFEVANEPNVEWHVLLKLLENGDIPMVSELIRTKDREGRFIWPETPLIQDRHALISKLEYPNISINEVLRAKVGFVKGTAHAKSFNILFPNHSNAVEFKTTAEALEALMAGNIDLLMASNNTILAVLHYMEHPGFKVNILFDIPYEAFFGFNKNERILSSIVDKALKLIDVKRISEQWKHKNYDYRIKLASIQFKWLISVAGLFLLIIILLLVLYKRIRGEGKRLEDLVQQRTMEFNELLQIMEGMSLTDQLTNLPNRRNFNMRLTIEWRIAIRESQPISFLMIDIDYFKIYNDRYGHQQGDEVLRIIANGIQKTLKRPSDFAARWGGEEFAVLLPNTDADGAMNIAELIRKNIEKEDVTLTNGEITKVTVSIGVNSQFPKRDESLEAFIFVADKELYNAKEKGRNIVCSPNS
jgi:diguanylate cyclase (GGDEF)-like protein